MWVCRKLVNVGVSVLKFCSSHRTTQSCTCILTSSAFDARKAYRPTLLRSSLQFCEGMVTGPLTQARGLALTGGGICRGLLGRPSAGQVRTFWVLPAQDVFLCGHFIVFLSLSIPFLSALPLHFDKGVSELLRGAAVVQQGWRLHPSQQGKHEKGRIQGLPHVKASYK